MERKSLFIEIILPLPIKGTFTYRVPYELNEEISIGKRVVTQFGRKKIYSGIVRDVHENAPKNYTAKYILGIIDAFPIVEEKDLQFWEWIAEYYMCNIGEVMNAALPSGLKLSSETQIIIHPDYDGDFSGLNEKEKNIIEALGYQKMLDLSTIEDITEQKKIFPLINTMVEKGILIIKEELHDEYKVKKEKFISINRVLVEDESKMKEVLDQLTSRAYKQMEIMMCLLRDGDKTQNYFLKKDKLLDISGGSSQQIKALEEKEILVQEEIETSRLEKFQKSKAIDSFQLTELQQGALKEVKSSFAENKVCLLHGITGSGKTEIYIHLIEEQLKKNKQTLYLLPEIALTTQIINRLKKYFGDVVGVFHSRFNKNERVEIWQKVLNKEYKIIIGARSSLFLPYKDLGLIIIDEEHDNSFKQYEPAPRYHARDSAIYLGQKRKANVILGSATPSIETYYNATSGKFSLVSLNKRYGDAGMPEILVADMEKETKQRTKKSHFSSLLLKEMQDALDNKKQIILFQNRRGFAPRLECSSCHWMPMCKHCDVSLVYHKHADFLKCHYCGFSQKVMEKCPECGSGTLQLRGFGTEKIEEEIPLYFPNAKAKRMDLDTTRKKTAYQQIIQDFEDRKIDILVGTQMLSKGLDFNHVSLVGILNADNMINYPDFRSFERSFQMISQVSGRAGRREEKGKVVIQSYRPHHDVIRFAIDNNYQEMYNTQILERRNFLYPPFCRLIKITLKHKDRDVINACAMELAIAYRAKFGKRILGPEYPMVSRIRSFYIKDILVKLEKGISLKDAKLHLGEIAEKTLKDGSFKGVRVIFDVDTV
jgi:primosomal protein N' (replication factor Y) (superfamily II helicase)